MPRRRASVHAAVRGLAALAALAAAATACGGGSSSGSKGAGDTLTLATQSPPASMDPAKMNVGSDNWFGGLAYAALIHYGEGGRLEPDLATKWGYIGKGNKTFELTLRPGVKFADGTPLDAEAVAGSLDYVRKNGLNVAWVSGITSITAKDPLTVRIECSTPVPVLPRLLTDIQLLGSIISPKGLAAPGKLGTQTFGAGAYVLDPAKSVSGSTYTYTPNPNYYDRSKVRWKKVVIKVLQNQNSAIQAARTGQVDVLTVDAGNVGAARSAGLKVVNAPGAAFFGVNLADREGKIAAPLKDVRVRQALNYAVDRAPIIKAVFQDYGQPSSLATTPGQDSYDASYDARYTYDPAKARKLLADAGYPNGFSFKMETQGFFGINLITQAVVDQWKKIGVTAQVTTDTTVGQWLQNATSGKFPVLGFAYGGLPLYMQSLDWFLPHKTHFNPFATQDPEMGGLLARGAAAEPADQPAIYRQAMRVAVDKALFVGVGRQDAIFAYGPGVTGVQVDSRNILPDPVWRIAPK